MTKGFLFYISGLVLAMGGAGGVEQSITNVQLIQAFALALVGCALMAVGVSYVKEQA